MTLLSWEMSATIRADGDIKRCLTSLIIQFNCSVMSDVLGLHGLHSTPGSPVHHQLLELAQTHVHQFSDAIQPSHPLSSPSPPAFSLSQISVFSNESFLHIRWPKYWSFSFSISPSNEYSGLTSFRLLLLRLNIWLTESN